MTTKNAVGNSLNGSTGSGAFVGATSPSLTTPTLGVASATSIAFGSTALNSYEIGTFTPVFTVATPGDISLSYSVQLGYYQKIGTKVYYNIYIQVTPTYTTASGGITLASLPFAGTNTAVYGVFQPGGSAFTAPANVVLYNANVSSSSLVLSYTKSNASPSTLLISAFASGSALQIFATGIYIA